jgi:hypothetical protein
VPQPVSAEDLHVEVFGSPEVAAKAPDLPEEYAVLKLTIGLIHHVESRIIPRLEPFARP